MDSKKDNVQGQSKICYLGRLDSDNKTLAKLAREIRHNLIKLEMKVFITDFSESQRNNRKDF